MADYKRKIRKMIPVLIPMIEGTELNKRIEDSIQSQSLYVNIIKCYAPGKKTRQRDYNSDRLKYEPMARNKCKEEASQYNEEYCIIQDDDIVQLNCNNFQDMREFLINNIEYGAVSIGGRTRDHSKVLTHIGISCVMFRLACLKKITFIQSTKRNCMCGDVTSAIRELGFKFDFLDDKIRVVEIN
jgi:hypothetical protein